MLSTDRQTNKQTNAKKNITSFAKEVKSENMHVQEIKISDKL